MSFQFLSETPQVSDSSLSFGHKEVVGTLKNIVSNQKRNLTIGMFGGWGSGKSSIVESLKAKLHIEKTPLIVFDVWKHEGDALRRTFLVELYQQLNQLQQLPEKFLLNDRIFGQKNIASEEIKIKWRKFGSMSLFVLAVTLVALVLFLIVKFGLYYVGINIFKNIKLIEYFSISSVGAFIGIVIKFFDTFIKTEKIEVKKEKLQDPHEFEAEFRHIIDNISADKIIITFDNLDRVNGENALKIISTIKTFLNHDELPEGNKTVIFLIPCDIDSMKKHMLSVRESNDETYIDEFLKKFFNTSLWIPEFYHEELEAFAIEKLKETKIEEFNNDYLSWLIIKVFYKNPRQIIQFINLLLSNYLLLKEYCEQNAFENKLFYKDNIPQLAKFLLIKQRHPRELETYQLSYTYDLKDELHYASIDSQDFKDLLRLTDDIKIISLEPFFKYRAPQYRQEYPETAKLIEMMASDEDGIMYEQTVDLIENSKAINLGIKRKLSTIKTPLISARFVDNVLAFAQRTNFQFDKGLFRELIKYLKDSRGQSYIAISTKLVLSEIYAKASNFSDNEKKEIIMQYLGYLYNKQSEQVATSSYEHNYYPIFEYLSENYKIFETSELEMFIKYVHENIATLKVDCFLVDQKLQKLFIRQNTIDNVIKNISTRPDVTFSQIEILNQLSPREDYIRHILTYYGSRDWKNILFKEQQDKLSLRKLEVLKECIHYISDQPERIFDKAPLKEICLQAEKVVKERVYRLIPLFVQLSKISEIDIWFEQILRATLIEWKKAPTLELIANIDLPGKWSQLGSEIQHELSNWLIEYSKLDELPFKPEYDQVKMLLINAIRLEEYDQTRQFWGRQRDYLEDQQKEIILRNVITVIEGKIAQVTTDSKDFLKLNNLLLFMADKNRLMLEKIDYWMVICGIICNKSNVDHQRFAFNFLNEHKTMISELDIQRLHEYLLREIRSRILINDYFANEALCLFTELYPSALFENYFRFAITFLLSKTSSGEVARVAISTIEKHQKNLDLSAFASDIRRLVSSLSLKPAIQLKEAYHTAIDWLMQLQHRLQDEDKKTLAHQIELLKQKSSPQR